MLNRKNQKLKDRNLPYTAIEIESNQYLVYLCDKGHKFEANEYRILNGKSRCPECHPKQGVKKTHAVYDQQLFDVEANLWPLELYNGVDVKIDHECVNGHVINIRPNSVLKGIECPVCSGVAKYTDTTYKQKLKEKNILYVPLEPINGVMKKILHQCYSCNHEWQVKPHDIMHGSGCPHCAKFGLNQSKPTVLYYVKLSKGSKTYYKIGVTTKTVEKRLWNEKVDKKVLMEKHYDNGAEALAAESMILEEYKDCLASDKNFISSGHTELFKYDVLGLDVIENSS